MAETPRPTLFERDDSTFAPPPPPPVVQVAPPEPEPEVADDFEPIDEAQSAGRRRRNPWLIVLWILGVLLTAAGLWGLFQAAERAMDPAYVLVAGYGSEQYRAPGVEDFYVIPIILASLSPWLTALGIGSIIAASTVHAVQWARRA